MWKMQVEKESKSVSLEKEDAMNLDRNKSISDIINLYFNHKTELLSLNDEWMKHKLRSQASYYKVM